MGWNPESGTLEPEESGTSTEAATEQGGVVSDDAVTSGFPSKDTAPNCPACGWGFLYPIAKTESGTLYHCFHCERSLSILDENPKQELAVQGVDAPTAAAPTHQQLAAQKEAVEGHPAGAFHEKSEQEGGS